MTPADLAQFGTTFGPLGLFVLVVWQVMWQIRKDQATIAPSESDPSDEKLNMILANQIKMAETMATISERLAVAAARQEERAIQSQFRP
jgi:hypothetical protein